MSTHPTNVVVMPPLSEMGTSTIGPSGDDATVGRSNKKRRRQTPAPPPASTSPSTEELLSALTGSTTSSTCVRARGANGAPLTATHEIRLLRSQVADMEEQLCELHAKWSAQIPDARMLATAQHTAREKHGMLRVEAAHKQLEQMLLQQQLLYATLQSGVLRAPLHSSGQDMLEALHFNTHLGRDELEREKMLIVHQQRSQASVASAVARFSQVAVDKIAAQQDGVSMGEFTPELPFSQIDITGGVDHTVISSVFISEIPSTSLQLVHEAMLSHFDMLGTTFKVHFGVELTQHRLNRAESPVVYNRMTLAGENMLTSVNSILCSDVTETHGMLHFDVIMDDALHPCSLAETPYYAVAGGTISPRKDAAGKTVAMTVRWIVIYHYKLLAGDAALQSEMKVLRPILNGDLITSSICEYIQGKQQPGAQL